MEDYAAKMALKPDAALRKYVTGYTQYREAAVLAALAELRQRGQPAPEEETLRPQLEAAVQQQAAEQMTLARSAAATSASAAPVLYTPVAIILFSVVFSLLAGAVLLALNMRRQQRSDAVPGLFLFVVVYLAVRTFLGFWLIRHGMSPLFVPLFDLPAIVLYVQWFWPRFVSTYQFQPRSWLVPLLVCLVVITLVLKLASHYGYGMPSLPGTTHLLKQ